MSLFRRRPGLGYLRDPEDSRDYRLSALRLATTPPPAVNLSRRVVAVLDQGSTNSCVANAWAQAIQLSRVLDGVPSPELASRKAIYWWARAEHGDDKRDEGTYLRSAAKAITHFGLPPEKYWPFDRPTNKQPSYAAHRAAFSHRGPRGYYRITEHDLDGIRRALASNKPVVFGLQIGVSFFDNDGPNTIDTDRGGFVGGHAMALVGYDRDRFQLVNSWGTRWRANGFAWLTERRMAEAHDVWAADFDPGTTL